ncbi:MAG TPA: polyphenol oxidase family protein [Acidimicrobiales bacterium]|nr:polyphenol oxidase family protein [Acidimicrobiales bacterium]
MLPGGVRAVWTGRAEGDLGPGAGGDVSARRRAVVDRTWSWLRQVHGASVVSAGPGQVVEGLEADAVVADPGLASQTALAVFTADCGPLALASPEGAMAAVHAGWRGLVAGVVPAAVEVMRRAGARSVVGALGPCIHAECYEFGASDLAAVEREVGAAVGGVTAWGAPALDLPAAVAAAAEAAGVELVFSSPVCTACSPDHYSHRARGDTGRQALVVWRD